MQGSLACGPSLEGGFGEGSIRPFGGPALALPTPVSETRCGRVSPVHADPCVV